MLFAVFFLAEVWK